MAPSNGTTSTPPKLAVTLPFPHHSTLQWHPAMAPRPLHPAMAPWCHVQSAKVVRRPHPLLEVRTPIAIAIWGIKRSRDWTEKDEAKRVSELPEHLCISSLYCRIVPRMLSTVIQSYLKFSATYRTKLPTCCQSSALAFGVSLGGGSCQAFQ